MDRIVTLLATCCIFLAGGLAFDRLPPIDWRGPFPILGPHIRYDSLKAQRDKARAALKLSADRVKLRGAVADGITASVAQTIQAQTVQVRTVTRTLREEVPIYVTAQADNRCVVSAGAVSLLNAAARGEATVPAAAGGPVDAPSGVPLSAVVDTGIANLGVGHELLTEVLGWRSWYAQQKAAWDLF